MVFGRKKKEKRPTQAQTSAKFALREPRYTNRISPAELLDFESSYGRTLFGPIPEGHRREFFEHKKNVWIWYEKWQDTTGEMSEVTIRYEVRPAGVYKKIAGRAYERIDGAELTNFRLAARGYLELIKANLYS